MQLLPPPSTNISKLGKSIVLHNNKRGNNYLVANILAKKFKCNTASAEDFPCLLNFETVIIVVSNTGDEELPQPMEDYLFSLKTTNKKYIICELGNYFGLDYKGCKSIVFKILEKLNWEKISDASVDSFPKLDNESLDKWMSNFT